MLFWLFCDLSINAPMFKKRGKLLSLKILLYYFINLLNLILKLILELLFSTSIPKLAAFKISLHFQLHYQASILVFSNLL